MCTEKDKCAKNYKFPYESILSVKNVPNKVIGQRGCPYLAKKGDYYPLYNIDRIVDTINKVKEIIQKDVENKIDNNPSLPDKEIQQLILQQWKVLILQELSSIYLRVILEPGYKEELRCVPYEQGAFVFDLGNIKRVNSPHGVAVIDKITVNNKTYHIGQLQEDALIFSFDFK